MSALRRGAKKNKRVSSEEKEKQLGKEDKRHRKGPEEVPLLNSVSMGRN